MGLYLVLPFCLVLLTLVFIKFRNASKKLPPGPWGLPLIGHLMFLGSAPHRTLMSWRKKYGSIIYARMGSYPCVFLCEPKLIKQAFGMAELAGRAHFAAVETKDRKGVALAEGPQQVEQRHFALTTLKDFGMGRKGIEGHIQDALGQFLDKIRIKGGHGRAMNSLHISSAYVLSSLCRVLMTDELTPEEAVRIGAAIEKYAEIGPIIGILAIFMPWMETLTKLVTFGQISLVKWRQDVSKAIYQMTHQQVEKRRLTWVKGCPRDVVDAFLDRVDETKDVNSTFHYSQNTVSYFTGDLIGAGVHTTSVTMEWMFLYMATYPSPQRKLQDEIDSIVGPSRVPAFSDRPRMPYVEAAIYELLRLSSIGPLGFDHKCLKEVILQDYRIPKGTIIFANLYGLHYDPEVWGEDVEEYKPERWFGDAGRKLKSEHFIPFLVGKRSCIGESLARDTLFIFITGIFQRFSVAFERGCSGPGLEPILGLSLSPKPFNMVFTPRHTD